MGPSSKGYMCDLPIIKGHNSQFCEKFESVTYILIFFFSFILSAFYFSISSLWLSFAFALYSDCLNFFFK